MVKKEEIKEEVKEEEVKEETCEPSMTNTVIMLTMTISNVIERVEHLENKVIELERYIDDLIDNVGAIEDRPTITNIFHQEKGGIPLTYESIKRNIME